MNNSNTSLNYNIKIGQILLLKENFWTYLTTWKETSKELLNAFVLHNNVHKETGFENKNKIGFLRILSTLFQNINPFTKEFHECFGFFSEYVPILKKGLGLVSNAYFQHIFPFIYQLTKFHYQTFFISEDVEQLVFLNSC